MLIRSDNKTNFNAYSIHIYLSYFEANDSK